MEMDRTCPTKRPLVSNDNSSALDPSRQENDGETKNIMEKDSVKRAKSHAADPGINHKAGPG